MSRQSVVQFYNSESTVYSQKRYEGRVLTYVQYFFRRRCNLLFRILDRVISDQKGLTLIDIGCADGIVTRKIDERFPGTFSLLTGVDISPLMIEKARRLEYDSRISFFLKDTTPDMFYDIALGLGYVSGAILENEIMFAKKHLVYQGYYICSLTAKNSLHARFKLKNAPYRADYRSYDEYRSMLLAHFDILAEIPYGLFIPKLWALPVIGRLLQPFFEIICAHIVPNLFHEKIYLLKLKNR